MLIADLIYLFIIIFDTYTILAIMENKLQSMNIYLILNLYESYQMVINKW